MNNIEKKIINRLKKNIRINIEEDMQRQLKNFSNDIIITIQNNLNKEKLIFLKKYLKNFIFLNKKYDSNNLLKKKSFNLVFFFFFINFLKKLIFFFKPYKILKILLIILFIMSFLIFEIINHYYFPVIPKFINIIYFFNKK